MKTKSVVALLVLIGVVLMVGCKKKVITFPVPIPTNTPVPPTPDPTPVYCGNTGICMVAAVVQNSLLRSAVILLQVDGAAEATAAVTIVSPGGSVEIPYGGPVTVAPGVIYSQYFVDGTGWTYVAGQTITIIASTSQGVASCSDTAPGDITHAVDGSQSSWAFDGNEEQVTVSDGLTTTYDSGALGDLVSPHLIPGSAYPIAGFYNFSTVVSNRSLCLSAAIGSNYLVLDNNATFVTK